MRLTEGLKYIVEGASVDAEYNRNYSSIDRETFEKIAKADPRSNVSGDELKSVGFGAKSLLLRCYMNGETDIIDNLQQLHDALVIFYENQSSYPPQFKNLNNFPSTQDFLNFVEDPDETEIEVVDKKVKDSGIDGIYLKYYSAIDRKVFDDLIKIDPKTDGKKIGIVAKNLLLPKYMAGEKDLPSKLSDIEKAIKIFYDIKDTLPSENQKIESYESVEDFVSYLLVGPEADFIKRLKENPNVPKEDWEIVASTFDYDVILVKSPVANNAITCDNDPRISHGTEYLKWCTGWSGHNYWSSYAPSNYIYDFLYKKDVRDRDKNYQLALNKVTFSVYKFLDGHDEADGVFDASTERCKKVFEAFLLRNLDLTAKLKDVPYLKNNDIVKDILASIKFKDTPFIYTGPSSLLEVKDHKTASFVKKIIIKDVDKIQAAAFADFMSLEEVQFNEGLKKIGSQAFMNCKALTTVVFPESLEEIGSEAFAEDVSLRGAIKLPNNVVKIGREAFRGTHCKLSIDRNRTKKLKIDPEDKTWFLTHHKAITVQEDLNEAILDENIPLDLVKAYRTSEINRSGSVVHPETSHTELINPTRRGVKYNYGKANYKEITKEEAKRIGRYEKDKVDQLRFIVGGKLIEYELRRNNALHQVYSINIPWDILQANGIHLFDKRGEETNNSKFASFNNIVDLADKIYQTDEYDHLINNTTLSDTIISTVDVIDPQTGEVAVNDEGRPVRTAVKQTIEKRRRENTGTSAIYTYPPKDSPSYVNHEPATSYEGSYQVGFNRFDSGSHDPYSVNLGYYKSREIREYLRAAATCKNYYEQWDNYRRNLRKLIKDKDLYDEEAFNQEKAYLETLIAEVYDYYLRSKKALQLAKSKVVFEINYDIKERHDAILTKLKVLQSRLQRMREINQKQNDLRYKRFEETDPEAKKIQTQIEEQEIKIAQKKEEVEKLQAELEELQRKIQQITEKINNSSSDVGVYLEQIITLSSSLEEMSEKALAKKFKEIDELEEEKRNIEAQLDTMFKSRQNAREREQKARAPRPMDKDLEDIIDFSSSEEVEEVSDEDDENSNDEE